MDFITSSRSNLVILIDRFPPSSPEHSNLHTTTQPHNHTTTADMDLPESDRLMQSSSPYAAHNDPPQPNANRTRLYLKAGASFAVFSACVLGVVALVLVFSDQKSTNTNKDEANTSKPVILPTHEFVIVPGSTPATIRFEFYRGNEIIMESRDIARTKNNLIEVDSNHALSFN